jgi:co-chaperonin GroES (HSP10)
LITDPNKLFKKVINGHIVLEVAEFKYEGKIVIPETAKRSPTKGKVIAKADDITSVELGDIVLFSQFAGYPLIFQGQHKMRVIGIDEVIAILHEDSPELEAQ